MLVTRSDPGSPLKKPTTALIGAGSSNGSPISSPKSSLKTEDRIMAMIKSDNNVTTDVMATQLGISKRAILKQIDKLKKQGKLMRRGSARAGYWELI